LKEASITRFIAPDATVPPLRARPGVVWICCLSI
jgi:hypothetical protein